MFYTSTLSRALVALILVDDERPVGAAALDPFMDVDSDRDVATGHFDELSVSHTHSRTDRSSH